MQGGAHNTYTCSWNKPHNGILLLICRGLCGLRPKGPITWSIYRVKISAAICKKLYQNQTRDYMTTFSTQGRTLGPGNRFNPGLKLSSVRGSDYLLQENKMKTFLLSGINTENV
jgi:hypothetical protein